MTDTFSKAKRSAIMASIHSGGNVATEGALISLFRRNQIVGWRRQFQLEGNPDFVFPKVKVSIFVDGCFWHACPQHFKPPQSNKPYWGMKIARNKRRDRHVTRTLRLKGWTVIRIWQHQLVNEPKIIKRIRSVILKKSVIEFARRV